MKKTKAFILSTTTIIFFITLNIIFLFNSKLIFYIHNAIFPLTEHLTLSLDLIIKEYQKIISYITNPLIHHLKFDYFTLSHTGEIHFLEVKLIYYSVLIITLFLGAFLLFYYVYKTNFFPKLITPPNLKKSIENYNTALNKSVLILILSLCFAMFIDFQNLFNYMHELLFSNNYWIFNYKTDSIIYILPETFFMLCGISILLLLLLESLLLNIYLKKRY